MRLPSASGGVDGPSIAGLEKFAKALDVDVRQLLTFVTKT